MIVIVKQITTTFIIRWKAATTHPPTTKSAKAVLCASHVNVAISLDVASE